MRILHQQIFGLFQFARTGICFKLIQRISGTGSERAVRREEYKCIQI